MWIRSQSRTNLVLNPRLRIREVAREYNIYEINSDEKSIVNLGTYRSMTRACEVLDEIQQHLEGHIYVKMARCEREGPDTVFDKKVDAPIVYEMPKE